MILFRVNVSKSKTINICFKRIADPHAHSCFKQFLWKNKGANCASMMSTVESPKLLKEFLYNLFETKLDGFTFTYLKKLELKSLLE